MSFQSVPLLCIPCSHYRSLTFAGTDTTSNGLARILHLLCVHPDVQEKLRAELLDAHNANGGQDLDYDDLVELPYLDAVCRETLRLYVTLSWEHGAHIVTRTILATLQFLS